jgi:zinc protease
MLALLASIAHAANPDEGAAVYTLDNGLTVVLLEDHRTDRVALHLEYRVGSRDEHAGEQGCAHLFEHLMFEGSRDVGPNEFDQLLTLAGGENNAWTAEDETAYHMTFPSGASDLGLFLESDRMAYLLDGLTPENLANQQAVVLQERAEGYQAPNGRDGDALTTLIWPSDHPYHHPVIGTVADVNGFTPDGVAAFFRAHYRPRAAVLVLVGNFDTAAMLAKVHTWFDEVPDPGDVERDAPIELPPRRADGVITDQVTERTLYIAWPTVPDGHPDMAPLDVLTYVLSDGRGTRLDDKLYFKSKLATDDGSYSVEDEIGGYLVVYATSRDTKLPKLAGIIEGAVAKLIASPPTDAELSRAKKALRDDFLNGLEYPEDRAEWIAECMISRGRPDCLAGELARYDAVTAADVARVASTWLVPERRITLSVIPNGDDGALPGATPVELP